MDGTALKGDGIRNGIELGSTMLDVHGWDGSSLDWLWVPVLNRSFSEDFWSATLPPLAEPFDRTGIHVGRALVPTLFNILLIRFTEIPAHPHIGIAFKNNGREKAIDAGGGGVPSVRAKVFGKILAQRLEHGIVPVTGRGTTSMIDGRENSG